MLGEMVSLDSSLLDLIKKRRSVKSYQPKKVPMEVLLNILEAARWAPSAHNAQPWRFTLVVDPSLKRRLADAMAEEWAEDLVKDGVSPDTRERLIEASIDRFTRAPLLLIASITMEEMNNYPDEERRKFEHLMATQSLAAALQNMLLAAHSMGLGSCWFCAPLFCQDRVRMVLGMPENVEPQALITLGYPSEIPDPPPRKPLEEIVYKNRWSGEL